MEAALDSEPPEVDATNYGWLGGFTHQENHERAYVFFILCITVVASVGIMLPLSIFKWTPIALKPL